MGGLLCSHHAQPRTKFPTVPSWLEPAVELRLGKISGSLAQYLVRLPQLPVLPLERLQPVPHLARHAVLKPRVAFVLTQPLPQGFPAAADLGRDRADRRPLRGVLTLVLEHHSHGSLLHLRRVALRCLLGFHGSILSGVGASGKPGAVQVDLTDGVGCLSRCGCLLWSWRDEFLLSQGERVKEGLHRGLAETPAALR